MTCTSDAGIRADAVGEVGQRRPTRQPQNLAVATRYLHAADRRGLHVVELLTPLLLRLAAASRPATGASTERTRGATATPTATRTRATADTCAGSATGATGTADHHGRHRDRRAEQGRIRRARQPGPPTAHPDHPHLGRAHRIRLDRRRLRLRHRNRRTPVAAASCRATADCRSCPHPTAVAACRRAASARRHRGRRPAQQPDEAAPKLAK